MRRAALTLPALLSAAGLSLPPARAAEIVTPPLVYPAETWQGRSVATLRVLDRLDSRVQILTVPVGQDVTFKALSIHVGACRDRPPGLVPDSAGWLSVRDTHPGVPGFDGWMLSGEPFMGVFENPLYDVRMVGCAGDMVAPVPPPLTVPEAGAPTDATSGGVVPAGSAPGTPPPVSAVPSSPLQLPPESSAPPPVSPVPVSPAPAAPAPAAPVPASSAPMPLAPVASGGVAGQHVPLPPPVPTMTDGGGAAPLSLLPAPLPPAGQAAPGSSRPDQAQPGQPQSLLPP
ncbi:hypothetical protein AA13595_2992 [Gluconacetobacter johannae DSM 13595]|uniref:DUF2155 domain-containing protein n=2 Tax=Gluconacetobacter johannae TaxID=112140 RepID=A0A7W4J7N4_9PROT|nr:DUF2155 domain-containing protein [Gluconacetobacter johannae]MBB2176221.1 DUF2155 domain-containing protein [Gluconacetobacter johannae]GBQ90803.1 hypothetical protein AA13595_2992 [Gluconacetobacter johannae DSM 13595]